MASCPFPSSTTTNHRHAPPRNNNCTATTTIIRIALFSSCASKINLRPSFPTTRNSWLGCCRATSPQFEPPPKKHPPPSSGLRALFSGFQDTLQIFFAVLFWMSLFFWSCAWDRDNRGRPNK
ncbi:hypothetical protein Salat_2806300 [Sesamum alatum]|uniref:Uncharacterized protein n=1 Tax=Sesamum alatum TaxID=300844 RepID=A0AAE1XL20_9LAMI|nr:hypothetical protein Salat_2806300 [Sesamum alatum]